MNKEKQFKKIKIENLNKATYNPRTIDDESYQRLMRSIHEHTKYLDGWNAKDGYRLATTVTINKNSNRIVGGHQRLDALVDLGQDWIHEEDITWVNMKSDSSEEKALNVALNNPKIVGEWDFSKLKELIVDIDDGTFDVSLTGFDEDDLKKMFDWVPKEITQENIVSTKDKEGLIEIICPHCKSAFKIKKDER